MGMVCPWVLFLALLIIVEHTIFGARLKDTVRPPEKLVIYYLLVALESKASRDLEGSGRPYHGDVLLERDNFVDNKLRFYAETAKSNSLINDCGGINLKSSKRSRLIIITK